MIDLDGGCIPIFLPFLMFIYAYHGPQTQGGFQLATFDDFIDYEDGLISLYVEFTETGTYYRPTRVTLDPTFPEYNYVLDFSLTPSPIPWKGCLIKTTLN